MQDDSVSNNYALAHVTNFQKWQTRQTSHYSFSKFFRLTGCDLTKEKCWERMNPRANFLWVAKILSEIPWEEMKVYREWMPQYCRLFSQYVERFDYWLYWQVFTTNILIKQLLVRSLNKQNMYLEFQDCFYLNPGLNSSFVYVHSDLYQISAEPSNYNKDKMESPARTSVWLY